MEDKILIASKPLKNMAEFKYLGMRLKGKKAKLALCLTKHGGEDIA
jgi:hypothetical protein